MIHDIETIWPELLADLGQPVMYWQLLLIFASILGARMTSALLRSYVAKHNDSKWQLGIGGINRALFPLSTLVFLYVGQSLLDIWQHTSLIQLVITAFWAMAIIRLAVYLLRYIFSPSGWLNTMENVISRSIWLVFVLHIVGLLPTILAFLEGIGFTIGKSHLNLLMLVQGLLIIVITLFISLSLSRWLENRLMQMGQVNTNVRVALARVMRVIFSLIAILLAMSAVGIDITLLSVFGGALGVGLGFGLQKIASNYVSGFIILLDDSMHIGDVITVDGHYGVVDELRFRYLVLRKMDGTLVVIPHETMMTSSVINHSHSEGKTRVLMPIQISYESDLTLAMRLMTECASRQSRVLTQMPVDTLIKGFSENGIDLSLIFWVSEPEEGTASLQSVIYLDIWNEFKRHQIAIPYPKREIHLVRESTPKQTNKKAKSNESQSNLGWDDVY